MVKNKDNALTDYIKLIEKSWTFARLTDKEKDNCIKALRNTYIFGNYNQRWNILQSVYDAFLYALDYSPIGWREKNTAPKF